jgi:hypothetical protein
VSELVNKLAVGDHPVEVSLRGWPILCALCKGWVFLIADTVEFTSFSFALLMPPDKTVRLATD